MHIALLAWIDEDLMIGSDVVASIEKLLRGPESLRERLVFYSQPSIWHSLQNQICLGSVSP